MNNIPLFDKFTVRARMVLSLAQEEARRFQHNAMGTEHLLLGLLREEKGIIADLLGDLGTSVEAVRTQLLKSLRDSSVSMQDS